MAPAFLLDTSVTLLYICVQIAGMVFSKKRRFLPIDQNWSEAYRVEKRREPEGKDSGF